MTDTVRGPSMSSEVETVLRGWAQAQQPDLKFDDHRVCFFVQPVQHRDGAFFVPGELALCRLVEGEADAEAGGPPPKLLSIWSYELKREILMPPAWVRLERSDRPATPAPAPQP